MQELNSLVVWIENPIAQSTEEEAYIDTVKFENQKHINRRVDLLMQCFNGYIC